MFYTIQFQVKIISNILHSKPVYYMSKLSVISYISILKPGDCRSKGWVICVYKKISSQKEQSYFKCYTSIFQIKMIGIQI